MRVKRVLLKPKISELWIIISYQTMIKVKPIFVSIVLIPLLQKEDLPVI